MDRTRDFFLTTRVTDLIDIVIISVFIYLVLVWLKKARARSVFFGMAAVALVYVLARIFGLYLTTMALQAFFAVAVIMIVIIFQDDLHHFFERVAIIGSSRRRRSAASFDRNADVLMSALANLSRKKIGALVVVKGRDPLERHIEAGIDVDGLLSQPLVESVFDPHVPTHDGAMVVEGARIVKLGCHLPLSINVAEIGRLGTRHAAALGIAEKTDAMALVVSEEQGTMAVAEEGRIRPLKDITQLKRAIIEFYRSRFPEKRGMGMRSAFVRNLPEKVLAVVLSAVLWAAFVHRTEMIRRDLVVPIEYRNLAPDRIITEPKVKEATVTVSGTEQAFALLKPSEVKISLDASTMSDGDNIFPLSKEKARNVSGVSVVGIAPEEVAVYSYRLVPLTVPIVPRTWGRVDPGFDVKGVRVEPASVAVLYPSTLPDDKATIVMDVIDLSGLRETTVISPKLTISPDIRFPDGKAPEVRVTVDIVEKPKAADEGA